MYWNLYFYSKVKHVVILRHIICYNKLIKQSNRLVDIMWFGRPFKSREIGHVASFSIWILRRKQWIPFMTLQVWVQQIFKPYPQFCCLHCWSKILKTVKTKKKTRVNMCVTKNKSTSVKKVSGLWDFKTWGFKA